MRHGCQTEANYKGVECVLTFVGDVSCMQFQSLPPLSVMKVTAHQKRELLEIDNKGAARVR